MTEERLRLALIAAGVGQLLLVAASLAIPKVLGWSAELRTLRPLTRQVFWTYAAYIWATNLSFGLLSCWLPRELLDRTSLAAVVTGFITLYWGARCGIQWLYFDRTDVPTGWLTRIAEAALNGLFVALTSIYSLAWVFNLGFLQ